MLDGLRFVALSALLVLAAGWDLRTQRIPNWLTFGGWGVGLILALITSATGGEAGALFFGMTATAGVMLLLYLGGGVGGGDVKLALGVGVLAGYPDVINYVFYGSLAALALILGRLTYRGELGAALVQVARAKPRVLHPGPDAHQQPEVPEGAEDAGGGEKEHSADAVGAPPTHVSYAFAWCIGVVWVWIMEGL